jgi:serine/threonine-protein kinase
VKDPRERLQAIGDARIEIKEAMSGRDEARVAATAAPARPPQLPVGLIAAIALASAFVAGGAAWLLKPPPATTAKVTRSLLGMQPFDRRSPAKPGESREPITRRDRTSIALTPDGRTLVIRALGDITEQLWVRPLDKLEATPLSGTEGADSPFISPDGAWVGYRNGAELRKIPIAGGVASTITRIPGETAAPRIYGASWGTGDLIVFATGDGLWQVNAAGGESRRLTTIADTEYRHTLPHILPDGRSVLYTIAKAPFRWDDARIVVRALDGGEPKTVIENATDPRYVASGHLVFVRAATMMALPFDIDRLEVTGRPVSLIENVMHAINAGNTATESAAAQITVSSSGRLVYATGGPVPDPPRALAWIDRSGTVEPLSLPERDYNTPRIAPDGRRLAVTAGGRIWVHDLQRGGLTAITPQKESAIWNIWSPDGQRIAYTASGSHLSIRSSDGAGVADVLYSSITFPTPSSWSSDGRLLAMIDQAPATQSDIWIHDLADPKRSRRPYLQTPASEAFPEFSPDGKWMAYQSSESGRPEIYVQPYPGPGPRVQISTEGGSAPAWTSNGAEIVYPAPAGTQTINMMAVAVKATGTVFSVDKPRQLFTGRFSFTGPARGYDVTADGRRFLMVETRDAPPQPPVELVLVDNWFEELNRASQ